MAILKQRLHKRNDSGDYDTIYLETSGDIVKMADGTTLEVAMGKKANMNHGHVASDITSGVLPVERGGTGAGSIDELKTSLGVTYGSDTGILTDVPTELGATYTFANREWIIVHVTDTAIYAAAKYATSDTGMYFSYTTSSTDGNSGDNRSAQFLHSPLFILCKQLHNQFTEAEQNALIPLVSDGAIATKITVFVPTFEQVSYEFDYYAWDKSTTGLNKNPNRVVTYNGTAVPWWTSSWMKNGDGVASVNDDGQMSIGSCMGQACFRPHIAFRRNNGIVIDASSIKMPDGTLLTEEMNKKASTDHTHSGYAGTTHSHAASDITSGILPVTRGGTGGASGPGGLSNLINTCNQIAFSESQAVENVAVNDLIPIFDVSTSTAKKIQVCYLQRRIGAQMASGTYTGAGKCGKDNPTVITVGFRPKFVIVCYPEISPLAFSVYFEGCSSFIGSQSSAGAHPTIGEITDTSISCYYDMTGSNNPALQFDKLGCVYYWFALG